MSDTAPIDADLDTLRAWNGTVSNEANTVLRMCLDVAKFAIRSAVFDDHLRPARRPARDRDERQPVASSGASRSRVWPVGAISGS